jgi:hypothetical protein
MDDYQVRPGQRIRVKRSRNNCELLLGEIQQDMPDALIKELCHHISKDLQVGTYISAIRTRFGHLSFSFIFCVPRSR